MITSQPNTQASPYCFCTLALGNNYRNLALQLAQDLAQYAPSVSLVVLTDRPAAFADCPQVLAFAHQQQSLGCYHDKQFVLKQALSLFPACVFVDADMRILAPIPADLTWQPGITAKLVWTNILKHNKNPFELRLLQQMAQKLDLDLAEISFVHECLFVLARDQGKELVFLEQWEKIARYFELRGFCRGEGHTIGLAAAQAGLTIRRDELTAIHFFKDKLAASATSSATDLEQRVELLKRQKALEYPKQSLWQRVWNKLLKLLRYQYRRLKLQFAALKQIDFYYR
ncbi:MAG: hypothetical protein ACKO7W_06065 [Elainella sp.]